jgi:hypothetical protein
LIVEPEAGGESMARAAGNTKRANERLADRQPDDGSGAA